MKLWWQIVDFRKRLCWCAKKISNVNITFISTVYFWVHDWSYSTDAKMTLYRLIVFWCLVITTQVMYKKADIIACVCLTITMLVYKYYYQPYRDEILLHQRELNNTLTSDQSYLIFNRVPKAGSQTIRRIIRVLAPINGFKLYKGLDTREYRKASEKYFLSEEDKKFHINSWSGHKNIRLDGIHKGPRTSDNTITGE